MVAHQKFVKFARHGSESSVDVVHEKVNDSTANVRSSKESNPIGRLVKGPSKDVLNNHIPPQAETLGTRAPNSPSIVGAGTVVSSSLSVVVGNRENRFVKNLFDWVKHETDLDQPARDILSKFPSFEVVQSRKGVAGENISETDTYGKGTTVRTREGHKTKKSHTGGSNVNRKSKEVREAKNLKYGDSDLESREVKEAAELFEIAGLNIDSKSNEEKEERRFGMEGSGMDSMCRKVQKIKARQSGDSNVDPKSRDAKETHTPKVPASKLKKTFKDTVCTTESKQTGVQWPVVESKDKYEIHSPTNTEDTIEKDPADLPSGLAPKTTETKVGDIDVEKEGTPAKQSVHMISLSDIMTSSVKQLSAEVVADLSVKGEPPIDISSMSCATQEGGATNAEDKLSHNNTLETTIETPTDELEDLKQEVHIEIPSVEHKNLKQEVNIEKPSVELEDIKQEVTIETTTVEHEDLKQETTIETPTVEHEELKHEVNIETPTVELEDLKQAANIETSTVELDLKQDVSIETPTVEHNDLKQEVNIETPSVKLEDLKEERSIEMPTVEHEDLKQEANIATPTVELDLKQETNIETPFVKLEYLKQEVNIETPTVEFDLKQENNIETPFVELEDLNQEASIETPTVELEDLNQAANIVTSTVEFDLKQETNIETPSIELEDLKQVGSIEMLTVEHEDLKREANIGTPTVRLDLKQETNIETPSVKLEHLKQEANIEILTLEHKDVKQVNFETPTVEHEDLKQEVNIEKPTNEDLTSTTSETHTVDGTTNILSQPGMHTTTQTGTPKADIYTNSWALPQQGAYTGDIEPSILVQSGILASGDNADPSSPTAVEDPSYLDQRSAPTSVGDPSTLGHPGIPQQLETQALGIIQVYPQQFRDPSTRDQPSVHKTVGGYGVLSQPSSTVVDPSTQVQPSIPTADGTHSSWSQAVTPTAVRFPGSMGHPRTPMSVKVPSNLIHPVTLTAVKNSGSMGHLSTLTGFQPSTLTAVQPSTLTAIQPRTPTAVGDPCGLFQGSTPTAFGDSSTLGQTSTSTAVADPSSGGQSSMPTVGSDSSSAGQPSMSTAELAAETVQNVDTCL